MKKGISLISLIITIIVVIILAAIAIFAGFKSIGQARLAKFTHEVSEFETAAQHDYLNRQTQLRIAGENETKEMTYSKIAGGKNASGEDIQAEPIPLETLIADEELRGKFEGTIAYRVTNPDNIATWTTPRNFSGATNEAVYLTNEGEVIILPGLEVEKDGAKVLYLNGRVNTDDRIEVIGDTTPTPEPEEEEEELEEAKVKAGDFVKYVPTSATYSYNEAPEGADGKDYYLGHTKTDTITTDTNMLWKVMKVNETTGEILITTKDSVNSFAFGGAIGWLNYERVLNYACKKLYSNSSLGLEARSIDLLDLGCTMKSTEDMVAYYSSDTDEVTDEELLPVTINKKTYKAVRNGMIQVEHSTFVEFDDATSDACKYAHTVNVNGQDYTYNFAKPTGKEPILVTSKNETILFNNQTNGAVKSMIGLLGNSNSWVANKKLTNVEGAAGENIKYMPFRIKTPYGGTGDGKLEAAELGYSGNSVNFPDKAVTIATNGLRPVIKITSGLGLEFKAKTSEEMGTETNPWIVSKK